MFEKIDAIERAAMGFVPAIEMLNLIQAEYTDSCMEIEGERLHGLANALEGLNILLTAARGNTAQAISAAMKATAEGKKVAKHG